MHTETHTSTLSTMQLVHGTFARSHAFMQMHHHRFVTLPQVVLKTVQVVWDLD